MKDKNYIDFIEKYKGLTINVSDKEINKILSIISIATVKYDKISKQQMEIVHSYYTNRTKRKLIQPIISERIEIENKLDDEVIELMQQDNIDFADLNCKFNTIDEFLKTFHPDYLPKYEETLKKLDFLQEKIHEIAYSDRQYVKLKLEEKKLFEAVITEINYPISTLLNILLTKIPKTVNSENSILNDLIDYIYGQEKKKESEVSPSTI